VRFKPSPIIRHVIKSSVSGSNDAVTINKQLIGKALWYIPLETGK